MTATRAPEVTVIVPTRDRWRLLSRHALPSALGQEDVALEVVVVDDGSRDGTQAMLARLDDPRVRIVRNDPPRRLPGARNRGIEAARGEWLAFLDDDDLWAPSKLRRQLDAARATGAFWAYGRSLVVDVRCEPTGVDPFPEPAELPALLLEGNFVPGGGSNVIARADAVRRIGGFDERLRFFEDWDLWLRLLAGGLPAGCDELVTARLEHPGNMVVRNAGDVLEAYERMLSKHRTVGRDDLLSVSEWLAGEQVRAGRRARAARLYLAAAWRFRSPGNLPAAAGALLGERGLAAASTLLRRVRGASHLDLEAAPAPPAPAWLDRYGAAVSAGSTELTGSAGDDVPAPERE